MYGVKGLAGRRKIIQLNPNHVQWLEQHIEKLKERDENPDPDQVLCDFCVAHPTVEVIPAEGRKTTALQDAIRNLLPKKARRIQLRLVEA